MEAQNGFYTSSQSYYKQHLMIHRSHPLPCPSQITLLESKPAFPRSKPRPVSTYTVHDDWAKGTQLHTNNTTSASSNNDLDRQRQLGAFQFRADRERERETGHRHCRGPMRRPPSWATWRRPSWVTSSLCPPWRRRQRSSWGAAQG